MPNGTVESIYIAGAAESKPQPIGQVTAIPEAVEALQRDYQIELSQAEARRNMVTRDVALNHLVGREFVIGDVRIRDIRLCEPCAHLQGLRS
jgi:MOSC domain-containing protein YiiM